VVRTAVDNVVFRLSIFRSVPEIFSIEVKLYNKSRANRSAEVGLIYERSSTTDADEVGDNNGLD